MDLQEAFDAGFVAVKSYVDTALAEQARALPELIKSAVAEAISALPAPKDGDPGRDAEPVSAEQIAMAVRGYLADNPPEPGKDGEDGKTVDPDVIRQMVQEAVGAIPAPKDGDPGQDADPELMRSMITEAVAALPPPEKGKDADPISEEQIAGAVRRYLEAHPVKDGEPGKDGVGLAAALIDKDGCLVVTLTNGEMRALGKVVGKDGVDAKGEPGRDALKLSGFDTALSEDGRILTLSLENDDLRVTHELQLPVMIYRGVFKEGQTYLQGDTVTFGGCLWHCNAETTEKPLEGRGSWQLAARKGRDGKDAKP
jgi:hypothetical protein